ncbi:MAG: hypothetical protein BA066_07255 [Candidatus Korarchaeota archaeon NZ13-K]|nr:MAG: hypothetical protein BA066_07255 [Candidatus Korarchaeota archaeon NZ13-K]
MDPVRAHMLLALTMAALVVGWGVMLSPPFRELRAGLGMPTELPGARYNASVGAAEIISPDEEGAKFFMARVAHFYHSTFAVLLYGMAAVLVMIRRELGSDVLNLTLLGTLATVLGAQIYSYVSRTFFWHGLFISGLAIIFSSGLLIALRFRPSNPLELSLHLALILLLIGGVIGAYVGSSYMNPELARDFERAKILARFNPDLAEENEIWRAMTGHLHTMVALATTATYLLAVMILGLREGTLPRLATYLVILGELVMAVSSYSVWFFGKVAHLIITPAALLLIASTLILSFMVRSVSRGFLDPKGPLLWGIRLGNLWTWAFIAVPGALVAMSLRRPLFFDPEFRNEVWDWAELSYNIGHWHEILLLWGVVLLLVYISQLRGYGRLASISGWLSLTGMLLAMAAINLYMLANPPGRYSPNPYSNFWLSHLVEPGLVVMSAGIVLSYLAFLLDLLRPRGA